MIGAILGAILIGISLGVFGSGGSILTVPVLLYLADMPGNMAIASSLLIVAFISLFGGFIAARKKIVSWRHVWLFGIPGMLGAYLGAWAGSAIDPRIQLLVFVILMAIAAFMMWRKPAAKGNSVQEIKLARIIFDGLIVGAVTGFVGVGGGFLIVPALVLLGGVPMFLAIGTSLMIIALKSFVGFAKYFTALTEQGYSFDWATIAIVTVAGIVGSFAGAWISARLPRDKLQKGFAIFLIIMAVVVLTQSVL
ncbi:permease [Pseudidiomarina atlantica]|uniref:Probable membrane transporter protein n=1 Tax=Pseudidiomarina atlantica TaxID=1517416 RepID=A0A094INV9_9GAMM|nr:sulfite exporter TauE/SafE family protein [Pseudidiomarina atlantica]KFZ28807.1 permease [Pseudidiomarina atlantica]